ncbi:MAG: hypothetical protein HAW67_06990 [Endozoicomonadaceae bacterium]|nr:hypothetical protein [Endozoicomonadaceae bacterium]
MTNAINGQDHVEDLVALEKFGATLSSPSTPMGAATEIKNFTKLMMWVSNLISVDYAKWRITNIGNILVLSEQVSHSIGIETTSSDFVLPEDIEWLSWFNWESCTIVDNSVLFKLVLMDEIFYFRFTMTPSVIGLLQKKCFAKGHYLSQFLSISGKEISNNKFKVAPIDVEITHQQPNTEG